MPSVSVRLLLTIVVSVAALAFVWTVGLDSWSSWQRLQTTKQIVDVAAATRSIFIAMPQVRIDRSNTNRVLSAEAAQTSVDPQVQEARAAYLPATVAAIEVLSRLSYPDGARLRGDLVAQVKTFQALMDESLAAMRQPKSARRSGLSDDYAREATKLIDVLDANSVAIGRAVKLQDSLVDKLFDVKAILWIARNAAGDGTLLVSNAIGGLATPADAVTQFNGHVGRAQTAWLAAKGVLDGLDLDPRLSAALADGERGFFGREALDMQRGHLAKAAGGGKLDLTSAQWNAGNVPRLASVLQPANVALDVANARAAAEYDKAGRQLMVSLVLLLATVLLAIGAMAVIERRIVHALGVIRDRMTRLASGELTIEVPYLARGDEIGALGHAMAAFKSSLLEAEAMRRREAEEGQRLAALRSSDMRALADRFDRAVGGIVGMVASAATELRLSAQTLTTSAEETSAQSISVAAASEQASANVASVASATEELSSSVSEIARQVSQSAEIAKRAVGEAAETNARVKGFAAAADKIGSIVGLINSIAEQTNLLALNATIEAARAGEAGRGFAVVAAEVKQLADQTAKATAEISTQVGAIQAATADAAIAIDGIGRTIETMSTITATISTAVDGQGAATGEIARNVQEASRGTAEVSSSITGVTTAATESSAAAAQVLTSAVELGVQAETLRGEVAKFLDGVRAA